MVTPTDGGDRFYVNEATGETRFEQPAAAKKPEVPPANAPWQLSLLAHFLHPVLYTTGSWLALVARLGGRRRAA